MHKDRRRRTGLQRKEQRSKKSSSNGKRKGVRRPVQEVGVGRGYQSHLQASQNETLEDTGHRRHLQHGYQQANSHRPAVEGPVPEITIKEIQKQLRKMKNNKSCGPDGIPTETLRIVDKLSPDTLCQTMNKAFQEGISSARVRFSGRPVANGTQKWLRATSIF